MNPLRKKLKFYIFTCTILFILLGVGVIFLLHRVRPGQGELKKTETLASSHAKDFDYEVDYTAEGFKPNILTINLGQKVEFKNLTNIPMWPASDPHPTHTDYPQFDADADFPINGVYIFQFQRLGTFGYHNHEKSLDRGFIQVVDPANPLPNIDKTKQSQRATRDKLLAILKPGDTSSVIKLMAAINHSPAIASDCHDMAHDLGHKAYELYGFSGAMTYNDPNQNALRDMDHICAGGYMHGILEELFLNQPDLKNNPDSICIPVPAINRDSCYHGVGHGLMFVNKRDVSASLATCKSLPDIIAERRCYEGVWMEMYWGDTDHAGASSLGWDPAFPLKPCINAQADQKPDCFLYAHLGYLRNHPKDFTGVINLCTKSQLDVWDERYCLRGVGITMMKHFTSHHLDLTESLVKDLDSRDKYAYYQGVIGYSRLSNVNEQDLAGFCAELKTDSLICGQVMQDMPK